MGTIWKRRVSHKSLTNLLYIVFLQIFKVDVIEPPQGMTPPNQNLAKKSSHQPSKLRKFVSKYSAGLRIRAHPSLQSEQIGIVHVEGTIAFIDEVGFQFSSVLL